MRRGLIAASLLATVAAQMSTEVHRSVYGTPMATKRKPSKRYPQMVTASDREIREHNRNVNTRQVRRRLARLAA